MASRSAHSATQTSFARSLSSTPTDTWGPPIPVNKTQFCNNAHRVHFYPEAETRPEIHNPEKQTKSTGFTRSPYTAPVLPVQTVDVDVLRVRDDSLMPAIVQKAEEILGSEVTCAPKQMSARKQKQQTTSIQRLTLQTTLSTAEVTNELQKHRLLHGLSEFNLGDRAVEFQPTGQYTVASAEELAQGWRVNEFEHPFVSAIGLHSKVRMVAVEILNTSNEVTLPTVQQFAKMFEVHTGCCWALVAGGFCPCTPEGPTDYTRTFCADAHTKVTGCPQFECCGFHENNMLRDVPDLLQYVHEHTKWYRNNTDERPKQSCLVFTGHDFQPICAELFLTGWCAPKTRKTIATPHNCNFFHATLNVQVRCQPKDQQKHGNHKSHNHRHQSSWQGAYGGYQHEPKHCYSGHRH